MDEKILFFFRDHLDALSLYEKLEKLLLAEVEDVNIKVQASQISFYNRRLFGCVSFLRVRKKKDCPAAYLVVTFGLDHQVHSPRIEVATEPYPNRWTHHVLISEPSEINEELIQWLKEAAAFSAQKR